MATSVVGRGWQRPLLLAAIAALFVAIAAIAVWQSPGSSNDKGRDLSLAPGATLAGTRVEPGTTGGQAKGTDDSGPGASAPLRELQIATGTANGRELVGKHVELRVPIAQHINDVAFWAGPEGNRLLVVLARDTRDDRQRQLGVPSNGAATVTNTSDTALVSGTIRWIPHAEGMFSWGLTNPDRHELLERPIYLHVDRIISE